MCLGGGVRSLKGQHEFTQLCNNLRLWGGKDQSQDGLNSTGVDLVLGGGLWWPRRVRTWPTGVAEPAVARGLPHVSRPRAGIGRINSKRQTAASISMGHLVNMRLGCRYPSQGGAWRGILVL